MSSGRIEARMREKVFVGLSGGVDSSVSAALLKESGADVTGVFIKGWYPPGMPCTWADDRRDAMRVAARLRIPFVTLDASEEYKRGVIDYLLSEYAAGRTPNPDVMCNREVKFGAFYDFAAKHGAKIATGHYAQVEASEGKGVLLRGVDVSKDQSYFLWAVPPAALAQTLFPVGAMQKAEVRTLAEKFDLPVAQKKDSQGICFLGSISVDDFLRAELGTSEGNVLDEEGLEIGIHDGAVLYTLGERIALPDAQSGPWFVIRKDMRENTLTVSRVHDQQSAIQKVILREPNWYTTEASLLVEAQYRYHGPIVRGRVHTSDKTFIPDEPFPEPIALGQSLVFYQDQRCMGGGIIS